MSLKDSKGQYDKSVSKEPFADQRSKGQDSAHHANPCVRLKMETMLVQYIVEYVGQNQQSIISQTHEGNVAQLNDMMLC